MNYAKEAYRMAEQLEARLDARTAGGAAFTDPEGEFAEADAGAFVAVTATVTGEGRAALTFGGAEVAEFTVPGTSTVVFAAAEKGKLAFVTEGTAHVTRVMLTGAFGTVRSSLSPALLRVGGDESAAYAVVVADGRAVMYELSGEAFVKTATIGDCDDADVCAAGPVAAFSAEGNAYVYYPLGDGFPTHLGKGRTVAVCRDDGGYAAAVYDGSKVTVFALDDRLRVLHTSSCHGSPTVDGIAFVKGAKSALLVVSDGGRNLMRRVSRAGDCGGYADIEVRCE